MLYHNHSLPPPPSPYLSSQPLLFEMNRELLHETVFTTIKVNFPSLLLFINCVLIITVKIAQYLRYAILFEFRKIFNIICTMFAKTIVLFFLTINITPWRVIGLECFCNRDSSEVSVSSIPCEDEICELDETNCPSDEGDKSFCLTYQSSFLDNIKGDKFCACLSGHWPPFNAEEVRICYKRKNLHIFQ